MTYSRLKAPTTVACANPRCRRDNLDFAAYRTTFLNPNADPTTVHRVPETNPRVSGWNVICTCGHYTLFRDPSAPARAA